jgi:hypothetical protein
MTVSPMRTSLRRASSSLCKVALVTVTPPTKTGARRATGVMRAGTPDLNVDAEHVGQRLFCRVLVRHGPARLAGHKAKRGLQGKRLTL